MWCEMYALAFYGLALFSFRKPYIRAMVANTSDDLVQDFKKWFCFLRETLLNLWEWEKTVSVI